MKNDVMSCLLRAAGCCRYANGMLSLIFGILGNTILHWVCAWESVWIAECLEPLIPTGALLRGELGLSREELGFGRLLDVRKLNELYLQKK